MSALERIRRQVENHSVVLYMKGTPNQPQCGFSAKLANVLLDYGATFLSVDVLADPELRFALKAFSHWPTIPQLYVNGEFLGGCDITLAMYRTGELKSTLEQVGALPYQNENHRRSLQCPCPCTR
jgi:monothiol glutaredoxin